MKNFEIVINQRIIDAINYILASNNSLSKAVLAQKIGIKPAKFSEILNKRMAAGMDVIQNLCIEHGISAHWLITGEGEMLYSSCDEQLDEPKSEGLMREIELLRLAIRDKETIIDSQNKNIKLLEEKIEFLEEELARCDGMAAGAAAG